MRSPVSHPPPIPFRPPARTASQRQISWSRTSACHSRRCIASSDRKYRRRSLAPVRRENRESCTPPWRQTIVPLTVPGPPYPREPWFQPGNGIVPSSLFHDTLRLDVLTSVAAGLLTNSSSGSFLLSHSGSRSASRCLTLYDTVREARQRLHLTVVAEMQHVETQYPARTSALSNSHAPVRVWSASFLASHAMQHAGVLRQAKAVNPQEGVVSGCYRRGETCFPE